MSSNPANMAVSLNPGDKLDKYQIVGQIGAGGFAVVWKGYDSLLDRHVAIKQIMPDFGEDEQVLRERIRNEAKVQKAVASGSKHLVHVIDILDESRGVFIVMEFVDGPSLAQFIAQHDGPIDQQTALGIIGAIAMALQTIHGRGVVHRDLKPSNVLLPNTGGLKLCDFGMASLVQEQDRMSAGSVRYMAPELFGNDKPDPRADLYALGMIAYEMLAGSAKFDEAFKLILRDQRNQALRWMKWHTNPRVKAPPLHEINKAVPQTLSDLVARLMEKDIDARMPTAQDTIQAIRRHFAGGDTGDSAEEQAARMRAAEAAAVAEDAPTAKLPSRSKLPLILAAMLVFWLVVGGILLGLKSRDQQQRVNSQLSDIQKRYEAARLVFEQGSDGNNPAAYEEAIPKFQDVIDNRPAVDAPIVGQLSKAAQARIDWASGYLALAQGDEHYDARRFAEAQASFQLAQDLFRKADAANILKDDKTQLFEDARRAEVKRANTALLAEIDTAIRADDLVQARALLDQARPILTGNAEAAALDEFGQKIAGQRNAALVNGLLAEARTLIAAGRDREAEKLLRESLQEFSDQRFRTLLDQLLKDRQLAMLLQTGNVAENAGELPRAIDAYTQAMDIAPDAKAADGLELSDKIARLKSKRAYETGRQHELNNKKADAQAGFELALELWPDNADAKAGLNRLETLQDRQSLVRRARAARSARRYDSALAFWQELISKYGDDAEIQKEILQDRLSLTLVNAEAALEAGKFDEAAALFRQAQGMGPSTNQSGLIDRGLRQIDTWKTYLSLRQQGDDFVQAARFGDAQRKYKEAEESAAAIDKAQELRDRRTDAYYASWVAQVRYFMSIKNHTAARSAWMQAAEVLSKSNRPMTTELTRLRDELRAADPEGEAKPSGGEATP